MLLRLVLWNLADSKTTIGYLRDESVDAFEDVPGLRFKAWISDDTTERWGRESRASSLWKNSPAEAVRSSSSFGTELSPMGANFPDTIASGRRSAVPEYRRPLA